MESHIPHESIPLPAQLEKPENPGDYHNWWNYVWYTKREIGSQAGTEVDARDDVLEAQGVEIVTLRQVRKIKSLY